MDRPFRSRARWFTVAIVVMALGLVYWAGREVVLPIATVEGGASHHGAAGSDLVDEVDREKEEYLLELSRKLSKSLEGIPMGGSANLLRSPYALKGTIIDVSGLAPGTAIECPTTGRAFTVPAPVFGLLVTRSFDAPPFFGSFGLSGDAIPDDPLAEDADKKPGSSRLSAMDFLKSRGIEFGEGASVTFDLSTLQLTVTATPEQLEIVETFVMSVDRAGVPGQVKAKPVPVQDLELSDR